MIISVRDTYKTFSKKKISDDDLKESVSRADRGLIDARIGAFLIKQSIARKGRGRSKGFRTVVFYKKGDVAIFLHVFAKKDKSNLTKIEEEEYNLFANKLAALSNEDLMRVAQERGWKEIK